MNSIKHNDDKIYRGCSMGHDFLDKGKSALLKSGHVIKIFKRTSPLQKNYLDRFSMYVPISQECFQKRQRHRAFISRTFFLITTKSSSFPSRGRVTSSPKTQWTMKLKRRAFTIHQCKLNS